MKDVGISLTQKQVAAIIKKLENISVPREICIKNRYWDPLVLDTIYTEFDEEVPMTPYEKGAREKIDKMLHFLRDTQETSYMYKKYIPTKYQNGQMRGIMLSSCMKWAKEIPLNEILSGSRYDEEYGAENIDGMIELLENTISYHVPLLLKPIFDMKNPESSFLGCMQAGAFNIVSRTMIEMGIARETALYLNKLLFKEFSVSDKEKQQSEMEIRDVIKKNFEELPYWIQIQVSFLY